MTEKKNNAVTLVLPWPPSTNKTWRRSGRHMHLATSAKLYRVAVKSLVAGWHLQDLPLSGPLAVIVTLCPPDNRRRDEDNFAGKALFDALTHAGVWDDDSQIRRKTVEWGAVVPGGYVVVEISPFTRPDIIPASVRQSRTGHAAGPVDGAGTSQAGTPHLPGHRECATGRFKPPRMAG